MSDLYRSHWDPRYQEPEIPSADELADALERNEEERHDLTRELRYLLSRTNSPEARRAFRADGPPNSQMLYLKRQVMFKWNRLVDNWNLYMDLSDINMSSMVLSNEMGAEDASQQRHSNELYADELRDSRGEARMVKRIPQTFVLRHTMPYRLGSFCWYELITQSHPAI